MADDLQAIDAEIAELEQRRADALAAVPEAELLLAAADEQLTYDQRVYDEAGGQVVETRRAGHQPYGTHRERSSIEAEALAADLRAAEALHSMADEALSAAMVARNRAAQRRGDLLAEARRCEGLIDQAAWRRSRLVAQNQASRAPFEKLRARVSAAFGLTPAVAAPLSKPSEPSVSSLSVGERRAKVAAELANGASYRTIAAHLNMSLAQVQRDVMAIKGQA